MTIIDAIATDVMIATIAMTAATTGTGGTTVTIGVMNATVTAIGVAIATIVTMTGATVDEAIETNRSTTRRGTQADRLRSRRRGAEL